MGAGQVCTGDAGEDLRGRGLSGRTCLQGATWRPPRVAAQKTRGGVSGVPDGLGIGWLLAWTVKWLEVWIHASFQAVAKDVADCSLAQNTGLWG